MSHALGNPLTIERRPTALPDTGCRRECEDLLEACGAMAAGALELLREAGDSAGSELADAVAECALLCRTVAEAMRLQARTERDLRLICAAVCHLTADLCSARAEPWAVQLGTLCAACADTCRQLPQQHWRRGTAAR